MLNIMLDIETCALEENAAILSVALMPFALDGETVPEPLYMVVDTMSCFMAGMAMTSSQQWWTQQPAAARMELLHAEKKPIDTVFREIHNYLSVMAENYALVLWSRGLNFDLPKFEYCYRRFVEKPLPYKFWNVADVRTALRMAHIDPHSIEYEGVRHNALDDCRHQVKLVQAAFAKFAKIEHME